MLSHHLQPRSAAAPSSCSTTSTLPTIVRRRSRGHPSRQRQQHAAPVAAAAEPPAASAAAAAAAAGAAAAPPQRASVPVTFILEGDEITVEARPGQNIWEVANEAGAYITLGCSQGSCGVCEVEVWKYGSGSTVPSTGVARACIAGVPPGYDRLEVRSVPEDDIWGVDGYDT